jgi:hypothetical protein
MRISPRHRSIVDSSPPPTNVIDARTLVGCRVKALLLSEKGLVGEWYFPYENPVKSEELQRVVGLQTRWWKSALATLSIICSIVGG